MTFHPLLKSLLLAMEVVFSKRGDEYDAMAADMFTIGIMLYMVAYYEDYFKPEPEQMHEYCHVAYQTRMHAASQQPQHMFETCPWDFSKGSAVGRELLPQLPNNNEGLEDLIRDLTVTQPETRPTAFEVRVRVRVRVRQKTHCV